MVGRGSVESRKRSQLQASLFGDQRIRGLSRLPSFLGFGDWGLLGIWILGVPGVAVTRL